MKIDHLDVVVVQFDLGGDGELRRLGRPGRIRVIGSARGTDGSLALAGRSQLPKTTSVGMRDVDLIVAIAVLENAISPVPNSAPSEVLALTAVMSQRLERRATTPT
jgi:hypothetical protein